MSDQNRQNIAPSTDALRFTYLAWQADRLILAVIFVHTLIALFFGWHFGQLPLAAIVALSCCALGVLICRLAAGTLTSRLLLATLCMTLVALHIQASQGLIETHFGVFVTLAFLLIYRDWRPVTLAAVLISLHHLLFNYLQQTGWPVFLMSSPNLHHVFLHIAYVAAQTALECWIVTLMHKHAETAQDLKESVIQTLEQAVDGVIVLNEQNQVLLFNAAAENLWGYSREEILGENVKRLVPHAIRGMRDDDAEHNRQTGIAHLVGTEREVAIQHKDGTLRWGAMSISRVDLPSRILYTAFIRDTTMQRKASEQQRLLSTAVNESDIAMIVAGSDMRTVFVNAGCAQLFGYSHDEIIGNIPSRILTGPYTDRAEITALGKKVRAGQGYSGELLLYTKDRRPLWVSVTVNPVASDTGSILHYVAVLKDITETKMHEVLQHKVLNAIARETPMQDIMNLICNEVERIAPEVTATIMAIDEHGCMRPLAAPSLPLHYAHAIDGIQIGPQAGSCGTAAWRKEAVMVMDIASDPLWENYRSIALDLQLYACWSNPLLNKDGRVLAVLGFYYREPQEPSPLHHKLVAATQHLASLVLEREHAREHIHHLAHYDALTGLPNRNLLLLQMERLIHDARRQQSSLAIFFLNLDRFKQINDTQGHACGDQFLRQFANRLNDEARDSDLIGRLSGDEFLIVLPQCNAQQAAVTAERLITQVTQPLSIAASILHPSVSIGVALFDEDGDDVATLMRNANLAMQEAKARAAGSFRFFSTEMNHAVQQRAMLENDLRQALDNNVLELHYQPQVRDDSEHIHGVEALLRWQHPTLGAIPPMQFVTLAEECGLIHRLGAWVLEQSCLQMAAWRTQHIDIPHVAVNLSAINFQDEKLPDVIADLLQRHALQGQDLVLEITESVMLDPDPTVLATLHAVHALGVYLSMDDFGTGYSSLSYLHRLPIHELKLDRSFVKDIEHSETARALATSVLQIGKSLNMIVVAEGVETEAQRDFLSHQACHVLQGYLFSRPLPAAQLTQWISARALSSQAH